LLPTAPEDDFVQLEQIAGATSPGQAVRVRRRLRGLLETAKVLVESLRK
jgi:hypothetical protein